MPMTDNFRYVLSPKATNIKAQGGAASAAEPWVSYDIFPTLKGSNNPLLLAFSERVSGRHTQGFAEAA